MKIRLAVFCTLAFLGTIPMPSHALEVPTHKAINEYIAIGTINGFSLDSYLKNQLGFQNGVEEQIKFGDSKKVWSWVGGGGVTEDKPPGFFQIPYLRSTNHFHDPISNQGFSGLIFGILPPLFLKGESSIQWSQKPIGGQNPGGYYSWFDTRDYYYKALTSAAKTDRDKYFAETFRGIGQIMHLVQDASVPTHARNQFHVGYDYEKFILRYQKEVLPEYKRKFTSLLASPFQFDQSLLNVVSPLALVPLANLFDSEKYTGSNPGDAISDNVGLSEYTNANFFSDQTIFKNYPHPKKENTNAILKEEEAEDGEIDRKYYISGYQSENLALYSYIANPAPELPGEWQYTLDDTVHKDYAEKLIPRAVGYSAGLLEYFFRGKLEVRQGDKLSNGYIEITITNLSGEPLVDGDFELYYDDKDGTRKKIETLHPYHVENLASGSTHNATFHPPSVSDFDSTKNGYYMLVYRGQLEGEKDTVIGKYQLIQPIIPVMVTYDQDQNKIFFKVNRPHVNRYIDLTGIVDNTEDSLYGVKFVQPVTYNANYGVIVYYRSDTQWDTTHVLKYRLTEEKPDGLDVTYDGETYRQAEFEYTHDEITYDGSIGPPAYNLVNRFVPRGEQSVSIVSSTLEGSRTYYGPILNIVPYLLNGKLEYSFATIIQFIYNAVYNWTDSIEPYNGTSNVGIGAQYATIYDSNTGWSKAYNIFGYTGNFYLSRTNDDPYYTINTVITIYPEIIGHPITWGTYWPEQWFSAGTAYGAFGLFTADASRVAGFGIISDITTMSAFSVWMVPGTGYLTYFDTFEETSKDILNDYNLWEYYYLILEPHGLGTVDRASGMIHFYISRIWGLPDYNFKSLYVINDTVYKWSDPIPEELMPPAIYPYGRSLSDFTKELNVASLYYKFGTTPVCIYNGVAGSWEYDPDTGGGRYFDRLTLTGKFGGEADLIGHTEFKTGGTTYADYKIVEKTSTFAVMLETNPPFQVLDVNPANGLTNVPLNTRITVLFDGPVDVTTINGSSFYLAETGSGNIVPGSFSFDFDNEVVIFIPNGNLNPNTTYGLNLTTSIRDADGASLSWAFSGTFTTAGPTDTVPPTDTIPPTVTVNPMDGATQVPVNTSIVFNFSEPINPVTINSSTIMVMNNGAPIGGGISLTQGKTGVIFYPSSNFLPDSSVNVTLSLHVTDMAGNPIVGSGGAGTDLVSSFTTGGTDDRAPPQVVSITPSDGATRVDPNTTVSVTLSEPIDPTTVNTTTFALSVGETKYPGQISFSGQNATAIFTPDQPFPANSVVTVTLAAGISDLAGNTTSLPFTSIFAVQTGPVLAIKYSGPTTLTIGDTISVELANTGDVDTLSTYTVKLKDTRGIAIYQNTISDMIQAGMSKYYSFQIPFQAGDGNYVLYAEVTDNRNRKTTGFFNLRIIGLNTTLTTRTDKDFYLATEPITAITTLQDGPFGIEGGGLKIAVNRMGSRATGQFSQFLPKDAWAVFKDPIGVAVAPDGSFYVADAGNFRIQNFESNGKFNKMWGSFGSGNGQFSTITCIAAGPDGSVYVGDTSNWILRIQKFDRDGNFITKWGWNGGGWLDHPFGITVGSDGSVYVADQGNGRILKFGSNGDFISAWGNYGSGDGQLLLPTGIAVGPYGLVYVADTNNNRIQKFDSNGNFIAKWGSYGEGDGQLNGPFSIAIGPDGSVYVVDGKSYLGEHRIQKFDSNGNFIAKWLDYGSGEGSSNIAVAPSGSVYVTDTYSNRIQKFDSNGNFIAQWGNYGNAEEQFDGPYGIAIGRDGSVYVADTYNNRVQKFDSGANFVLTWGGQGSGDGKFYYPRGIAIGPDGSVFVADSGNARIQKFDGDGKFIAKWGDYGSGDGQFAEARGIAVGLDGLVYVADTNNNRIQVFDSDGNFITKWGSYGTGDGQFSIPVGIAISFDGSIFVADTGNNRIQVFDSTGNFIKKWGSKGSGDGQFNSPSTIVQGPDSSIFVADSGNGRIQLFDNDGVFITKWGSKGYENGQFMWPYGIALGPDGSVYVADTGNHRIQKLVAEVLFETTIPINQAGNTSQDYTTNIETSSASGSLYLQATLLNSLGQTLGQDTYPFFRGEPLSVVSVIPGMGQNNVPINTLITVQFSKPLDLTTLSSTSFLLVETVSGNSASGTFSFDFGDKLVIFRPNNNLIPNTTYTLSITKAIKSVDGIPLDQPFSSSFSTAGLADTIPPTVMVSPEDGATNVPVNAVVVFGFSEPMNPLTINLSTVAVTNNGSPVSGSITLSQQNTLATFTPGSSFLPNSGVSLTLSRRVTDLSGNPIVGSSGPETDFMTSFSTASAADMVPPSISSINPVNGATGIDISTAVSVTFSEPVNPITVNNASFIVSFGGTPYPGLISFSGQNTLVTFTPDQPFPTNSLVTVALSAGISDVAGNGMSSPFTSTFTTYQKGPVLTIGYSGAITLTIGDTISVEVANAGDIETTSTYMVKLSDANGLVIYQNTIIEVIQAGASKNYSFQIPNQAADSGYLLYAEATDSKSKKTSASFDLRIIGLNATLNTRTEKDIYLPTEAVTGITSIVNGPFGIENGSLKVSVSGIAATAAGGFKHFLPKELGAIFNYPWGIAVGPDGSVYVVDTDNHCVQKFDSNGNFITKWGSFGWSDGQFYYPNSIAVGSDGCVYVADTENHRIQEFDSSGTFVRTWGTEGSGNGQFYQPSGIAISSDGYVYVADTGNGRVQKFNSNGNFISKWGSLGPSDGQFNFPYGVGVGPDGSVYVADTGNDRVQKFNSNGNFISKWGSSGIGDGKFYWPCSIAVGSDSSVYVADGSSDRIQKFSSSGTFITKWGSYGEGNGQFNGPSGIAIGGDNSIYVTDSGNNRVEKYGSNGTFIAKWGSGGERDGAFAEPSGIAIGPDGSIYVTDTYQDRVQKFDAAGNFLLKWGTWGYGYGEFDTPFSVAVGPDGSVYIADRSNNLIQKFDNNGNFVLAWNTYSSEFGSLRPKGIAVGPNGLIYVVVEPTYPWEDYEIQRFDSDGLFLTKWVVSYYSDGIAIGPDGFVYVVAPELNLIQKFDIDGNYITGWGSYGAGNGEFNSPQGISVGPDGHIYVADTGNYRIQKFDGDGIFIAKWGSYGWQEGQFDQPLGIAVGSDGSVYVADTRNHRIQEMIGGDTTQTLFQATLSINQSPSTNQDYSTNIGALGVTAKLYLQTTLTNSLGQTITQSSYPFYMFLGDTVLLFNTDKKVYNPGETITITGRVENRGATDATNLVLTFQSKLVGQNSQSLYTDTFDLPAGGSHPFTVTTSAGAMGTVILTGTVSQNNSLLVKIKDSYEVTNP